VVDLKRLSVAAGFEAVGGFDAKRVESDTLRIARVRNPGEQITLRVSFA
jgi:hypothetical protein